MIDKSGIFLGASQRPQNKKSSKDVLQQEYIWLKYANRHGLITGATGTGKTVTLQVLAESFSKAGVPVFCADIKGDLSGIAKAGTLNDKIMARAKDVGLDSIDMQENPVIFWDLFGEQGHPIRATISEMGPLLLARLMDLTPAQEGVLNIAFRIADEEKLLLLDIKDLQSMLGYMGENVSQLSTQYGNVTKASIGSILRQLLVLEQQGGDNFFGEPALDLNDFMQKNANGLGYVSVLAANKLMTNPRLYATFLLWLMSELFEQLPEIGDMEKPKMVFFFDEAHLLFDNAPKALIDRIEQVVRLIRSKGVGIYFITQNPLDLPESVLAQLGNRVQHALRAYTPRETKAVKVAASTFRANPNFDTADIIGSLATGEALVSTLEDKGVPSIVQQTIIRPPQSQIGQITKDERAKIIKESPVFGKYDTAIDRNSAYELLNQKAETKIAKNEQQGDSFWETVLGSGGGKGTGKSRKSQSVAETALKAATRSAANSIGRAVAKEGVNILRGMLGNFLGGKR